jgi:hypothetical protein
MMIELIKDISVAQWVMIVIGIAFIMLSFRSEVLGLLSSLSKAKQKKKVEEEIRLTSIVSKWERLRDACHDAGLNKACDKLDEVFPMLVEVNNE